MTKMGLLVASLVFLFVLAFRGAASTSFYSRLALCPNGCSCSLFNTSLYVNCWKYWKSWYYHYADNKLLSKQLDSLLSSNQTYGYLTWLNITLTPLTHVPRSVCRLTTLTQLHLVCNRFNRLPDNCLNNLTALSLTSLSVFWNITELQDGLFDGLGKLKTLSLTNNGITELQNGLFDGLPTLETLHISDNDISSISSRVFNKLSNLKTLGLSHNGITELENGLFDGPHELKMLDLSFNEISLIGLHVFEGHSNLEALLLSHNNITELQDRLFDGLHKLQTLDVSHNDISSIGLRVFHGLSNTKTLNLSYNEITKLENGLFDRLNSLETLDLHHNYIWSIGSRVFGSSAALSSLRHVDMSRNNVYTLDSWPVYMGINRSVTIDLSHNHIHRFTDLMWWRYNCNVRTLHASLLIFYDYGIRISDIFREWDMTLSTTWCVKKRTDIITCVYLECDCVNLVTFNFPWWWLMLDYAINTSLLRPLILYKDDTFPLNQFVCELTERCPSGCRCVHRPANATLHISCSNTNLTDLPLELPTPKSYPKYILDLSNNRLLRRLEHRDYFANTSILDVSNSNIQQVESEDVWKAILKIPQLNLYGNKLMSLPQSVVSLNVTK